MPHSKHFPPSRPHPVNSLILKIRIQIIIFLFAGAFVFISFAANAQSFTPPPKQQKTSPAATTRFLVKSQDGKTINAAAQKGKVVFLNFWATTCIPCKVEMPTIDRLRQRFKDNKNVLILPVDLDNNLPASTEFMRRAGLGLMVYTAASAIPQSFFNGVLPTTVVLDKNGRIAMYHEGESDYNSGQFVALMDSLAGK
jgi:thiol-disulfide isomerase/thioredoxin